ncbi:Rib/alpha-like domain-containing protein [Corynebacterium macclintockiae]|uniref:Rib/alpha-like domain-containing protein n=1 Tax=Corynebacterium macclintockiae TaxID=2913501 RepID=UPI003EB7210C
MMFLRSRRAMVAVAAASSLVLTATAVPQSPFSPVAAQAATANKTQDTTLPLHCSLNAGGNRVKKTMDFTGKMQVEMPGKVDSGEVFEATISMDSLQVQDPYLGRLEGVPTFEAAKTTANKVRFAVKGDVELVESNLPATLKNGVLTAEKMMQPSRTDDTVTLALTPLKVKLKAKKAGKVEIQTPKLDEELDGKERVKSNNMFYGEGAAGEITLPFVGKKGVGLYVACRTEEYKPLGVTQIGKDAEVNEPKYDSIQVKQTDTVTSKNTAQAPEDTTYAKGANAPEWATVGQDGTVTVKPGLDVKPGDYTVPVVVTYPDSSIDNAVVNVTVKEKEKSLAEQHDPQFGETTVEQDGTATIPAPEGLPEGTKVAAGEGVPEWVTVNADGTVTAKPGTDVEAKEYTVPVKVSYPDDSADDTVVNVTVTVKPTNEQHDPTYSDVTVKQGDEVTAPAPTDVAEGAKFAAGEGAPEWVTVNEDGSVTVKPGLDVDGGSYNIPVVVTYPDGSTSTVELKVNVEKQEKPSGSSGSSNGSSSSSGVAGSSPLGKFFAALFGTIAIGAGLFGLYNWARAHGYVR